MCDTGRRANVQDKTYTLVTWNHLFRWWRQKAERFSDDRQIATNSMLSTPEMDEILRNAHPLSVKSGGSYEDVVEHVHAKVSVCQATLTASTHTTRRSGGVTDIAIGENIEKTSTRYRTIHMSTSTPHCSRRTCATSSGARRWIR